VRPVSIEDLLYICQFVALWKASSPTGSRTDSAASELIEAIRRTGAVVRDGPPIPVKTLLRVATVHIDAEAAIPSCCPSGCLAFHKATNLTNIKADLRWTRPHDECSAALSFEYFFTFQPPIGFSKRSS